MDKIAPSARHKYVHTDRTIYEWDQSISEVNIYIQLPPGVGSKQLDVVIATRHITVAIKGNPPYLDKDLGGAIKAPDSYWTIEDGELHLQLTKAQEADPWVSAIAGHELNPVEAEQDQKRLMLERFQAEHPGFDFSNAEFSGGIPDPRTFMRDLNKPE